LDLDASRLEILDTWFLNALLQTDRGDALHFVLRTKDDAAIGHTAIINIRRNIPRCDIAWTWIFSDYQRQGYARESKQALYDFLIKTHSFRRVQMVADSRNEASINSMMGSGAKLEYIMPSARLARDGTVADTAVFAVLNTAHFGTTNVA
jgi:RimJ/RimL family protein N-acetyltransferase